jgi:hypothetical protein
MKNDRDKRKEGEGIKKERKSKRRIIGRETEWTRGRGRCYFVPVTLLIRKPLHKQKVTSS